MKLALVNVLENRKTMPPMGLVYIATYLRQYLSFDQTRIIDVNWEDPVRAIRRYRPDVVGISSLSMSYHAAIGLAKNVKSILDCPVIIGGVHISTLPASLSPVFDFGVMGEGEETSLELVKLYEKEKRFAKEHLRGIPGLVWREGGKLLFTEERPLLKNLDAIPYPDMNFIRARKYFQPSWIPWDETEGIHGFLMTSRGCPYQCAFCSTSRFWQRVRLNSPEKICADVEALIENYKVTHITIWDDLFSVDKTRLRSIAEMFKAKGIDKKVSFICSPRANLMDDELCQIMRAMNVKALNFGFESGNDRVLRYLKGGSVSLPDNKNAVMLARRYGFYIYGTFIFGSPTETLDEMKDTLAFIDFLAGSGCRAQIWNNLMTPLPATPIWEIARQRGKVNDTDMDWRKLLFTSLEDPLLLDADIDRREFRKIFTAAQLKAAALNAAGMHPARKILRHPLKSLGVALADPARAITLAYCYGKRIFARPPKNN